MSQVLESKHIALLATDGFEDSELEMPLEALRNAGAMVTIVSSKEDAFIGKHGAEIAVDMLVEEAVTEEFDGLLLPGGVANPDRLRMNQDAVSFVSEFFELDKPVAAICHAPWLLIEADVVKGRTVTSWPSLKTDLENAGAIWVDEEVVVDDNLITSRKPDDLPAFCDKLIEVFATADSSNQVIV